jgi:hypothetical protein
MHNVQSFVVAARTSGDSGVCPTVSYPDLFDPAGAPDPRQTVLRWVCRQTEDNTQAAIDALAEAALKTFEDVEPEMLAAAVRLSAGHTDGIARLANVATRLRSQGVGPDPLSAQAALQELATGPDHPATLGRVAVGITMVLAGTAADHISDAADDLVDDVLDAGWLFGSDADAAVLERVIRSVESSIRRADTLGSRAA